MNNLEMLGVKDLGNGQYEIKGVKLSLSDILGLATRQVKTTEELVERAIQQEFSRAKTAHYNKQYAEIVTSDKNLMSLVQPFTSKASDFRAFAEAKVNKKK